MVNINVNTLIGVDPFTYSDNNSYIVVIGCYRHKTTYLSIKPPSSPRCSKSSLANYHLVMTNSSPWKPSQNAMKFGFLPSISMDGPW